MSGGISVNKEQLDLLYSDGLPEYEHAFDSYSDGSKTANDCANYFLNENISKYLTNSDEIFKYILNLPIEVALIETGRDVFKKKVAYLIYDLNKSEGMIDLSEYSYLKKELEGIAKLSENEDEYNRFDETNLAEYEKAKKEKEDLKNEIKKCEKLTDEEILKRLGLTEEDMKTIIESLSDYGIDENNLSESKYKGIMAFALCTILSGGNASVGADAYWAVEDNELWATGTVFTKVFEQYIGKGYGGMAATLTIGTIITLVGAANGDDPQTVLQNILEEGAAPAIGTAFSILAEAGAMAVGIPAVGAGIAAVAFGIVMTHFSGAIFHSMMYYSGDIPKKYWHYDEAAQDRFLQREMKMDMRATQYVDMLIDSGELTAEEAKRLIDFCENTDIIWSEEYPDTPEACALKYYLENKNKIDNNELYDLNGTEYYHCDLGEMQKYIEKYKKLLKGK